MIDIDAELLDLDAGWREVLEAYQEVEEVGASEPDESTTDDQGMASDDGPDRGDEEPVIGLAELDHLVQAMAATVMAPLPDTVGRELEKIWHSNYGAAA